jgi:rsbT antagonist protein RsbS
MEEEITLSKVGMYVTRDCLVVPIQVELHDELVTQIQEDILRRVKGERLKGVVIDLSGVAILDSVLARGVFDTAQMTSLLGVRTVITGLSAGVVASLIDLDFAPGNVLL